MPEAVIVAAGRSPIGRAFKGSLKDIRPDDLAAQMVGTVLEQVPQLPRGEIEDVILGCGLPGGEQGFNMARVVALLSGLPEAGGTTVNRYCSSSLQTIRMAAHAIRAGEGDAFVAAGVECVSRFVKGNSDSLPDTENPRFEGAKARSAERSTGESGPWAPNAGLPDIYIAMGQTAENVADYANVSREEMDQYALQCQQRTGKALAEGFFERDITPVALPDGTVVSADDGPRPATTLEDLQKLKPAFRPNGRVTAGNACPLNDGAAAVVVMSDSRARELGITPLARVVASAVSALDPEIMGLGPIEACKRSMARAGMSIEDIDLVEINEAFAAQIIPSARELAIDMDKLNVSGGAIALGHPFGMTGARIMTTLIHNLQDRDRSIGMETMCVGGGQGMSMIVERLS
ncbi:MAG: acetyl-CoA C-acetyltransferase [Acidimicrobiia bacterium]|nr:acetyl-CoA C-acetyltransferase [Acidimicrobiia bacterium]